MSAYIVSEAEQRVGQVEDTISEHTTALRTLQTKIRALEYKVKDAENRNRRNNLQIVGLSEGSNPTVFIEDALRYLVPGAHFSPHYTVERVHRIPPKLGPWAHPLGPSV